MAEDRDETLLDLAQPEDPTRIDYAHQTQLNRQPLHDKFRMQVPIVLLAGLLAQTLTALSISRDLLDDRIFWNAVLVAQLANASGLLNFRNMRLFPGTRRFAFLIPAFVPGWVLVTAALLWLRVPYSVPILIVGGLAALACVWLLTFRSRKPRSSPFLLVPNPRVQALAQELPGMQFEFCKDPNELVGPKTIIADLRADLLPEWEKAITDAVLVGATVYHVTHVRESLTGRVRVDHIAENSFGMLGTPSVFFAFKSLADRIMGGVGLILAAPIIAIACIAIVIESRGNPIFKQTRIGYRARPFTIYKLRTMKSATAPETRESAMTKSGDARITRTGRFLRATRLDELPQFLNMLRGELSLVGPRPEAATLSQWYKEEVDFYAYRHVVRPGITGWAQVNQGHVADAASVARKLEYDFYYIKNFSLWLDVVVLLRTAHVIFSSHGAK